MSDPWLDEWIAKAEQDYGTVQDLAHKRKEIRYDSICFHCQQCAEKYLKAFLAKNKIVIRKIHDLDSLGDECAAIDSTFVLIKPILQELKPYAVLFRYPGASADDSEMRAAVVNVKQVRQFIRKRLGLK